MKCYSVMVSKEILYLMYSEGPLKTDGNHQGIKHFYV